MNDEQELLAMPEKEQRTWGMLCHLLGFTGYLVPFGNILGPLIIWLIKKDEMPFVDDQGKEALNFQLSFILALFVSGILCFLLIGFFLIGVVVIYQIIATIVACIQANEGVYYRYPYTIRFIK